MSREFDGNQSKWELEKKEENIFKIKNVEEQKYLATISSFDIENETDKKIELTTSEEDIENINQQWILAYYRQNKYRICSLQYKNLCLAVHINKDAREEIILTPFRSRSRFGPDIKQKTWIIVKQPSINQDTFDNTML
jgi:hypothetical protein